MKITNDIKYVGVNDRKIDYKNKSKMIVKNRVGYFPIIPYQVSIFDAGIFFGLLHHHANDVRIY